MLRKNLPLLWTLAAALLIPCTATRAQGPPQRPGTEPLKRLGEMLERDWTERPEWAEMAVAILQGKPMHPGSGWWRPALSKYHWDWLRNNFDQNGDQRIEPSELPQADEIFSILDRDRNGLIRAEDLDWSEQSAYARQGAMSSRVFHRLDSDSNGRITQEEIAEFFVRADSQGLGYLTPEDLRQVLTDPTGRESGAASGESGPTPLEMLAFLMTGQLGTLAPGPELNAVVPDFTLLTHDGKRSVTLSDSFGKKPVVLVFGSFT